MKKLITLVLCFLTSVAGYAQKYVSERNHVSFYSKAPMENIEAHTYKSKSVFDSQTGEIAFTVPIRTFEFEKSLMQEHFNENYLESHKFPRAKFIGKVLGFENKPGKQPVTAQGQLEIHGVSRAAKITGFMDYTGQEIKITAAFPVKVADYQIKIPSLVASKIAQVVEVTIDFTYLPYNAR